MLVAVLVCCLLPIIVLFAVGIISLRNIDENPYDDDIWNREFWNDGIDSQDLFGFDDEVWRNFTSPPK